MTIPYFIYLFFKTFGDPRELKIVLLRWLNEANIKQIKNSSIEHPMSLLPLGVNFINVFHAHFSYECLFSALKLALNKLSYVKCLWNWPQVSSIFVTMFKNGLISSLTWHQRILLFSYKYYKFVLKTISKPF